MNTDVKPNDRVKTRSGTFYGVVVEVNQGMALLGGGNMDGYLESDKIFPVSDLVITHRPNETREDKFERLAHQAKSTGTDVLYREYMADCTDPREECDLDHVEEYITPDGKVVVYRNHTW